MSKELLQNLEETIQQILREVISINYNIDEPIKLFSKDAQKEILEDSHFKLAGGN